MEVYEPMLAKLGDEAILERKNLVGFIFEIKFDGTRILIYKDKDNIAIFNRKKKDIIAKYPEFLDIDAYVQANSCILDGEIVVLNEKGEPDPKLLQQREQADTQTKIRTLSKKYPASIFVFDILELENKSLVSELLRRRKLIMKDLIKNGPNLVLCPYTMLGKDLWKQIKDQELGGMIVKEINSRYEAGKRLWSWMKVKNIQSVDLVVIGFTKNSEHKNKFESLILAKYDKNMQLFKYSGILEGKLDIKTKNFLSKKFKELSVANSLFSEEDQKKLQDKEIQWLEPGIIVRVNFKKIEQNELKETNFVRLRFDKKPEDCTFG